MDVEEEELERICFNCNNFFPASIDGPTEFGICLNDKLFEPFIDELLEYSNFDCCKNLINEKKFSGNREACDDFSEVDMEECIEFDENSEFGKALMSSLTSGEFDNEKLEQLLLEEQIRNIDFKTLPTDTYAKQLKSPELKERYSAISSLGALVLHENESAFQELFSYLKKMPPPTTIANVHFKIEILNYLNHRKFRKLLTPYLIDELYNTPSNNTTRQWISAIFMLLEQCPAEDIREPLEKMLNEKRFSYRLKQKMKDILFQLED